MTPPEAACKATRARFGSARIFGTPEPEPRPGAPLRRPTALTGEPELTTTEPLTRSEAIRQALADLEPRAAEVGHVTGREISARMAELGHPDGVTAEELEAVTRAMTSEQIVEMVRLVLQARRAELEHPEPLDDLEFELKINRFTVTKKGALEQIAPVPVRGQVRH
jgi:hypothetical protein